MITLVEVVSRYCVSDITDQNVATHRQGARLIKRLFRSSVIGLLLGICSPAGLGGPQQNKNKTDEDIAALKKQVQALEEGQQQILQELRELKKMLEARPMPPAGSSPLATLNVRGEPFKGEPGARIAIVEYSDFECPFCGKYSREIYPQIIDRYVKTGKVRYYFRDLPLPIHPNALPAALAARCAADQGKFWEMHDSLFANQTALSPKDFADRAAALGLDQAKFADCFARAKYADAIRRVASGARQMGIDGTPAFAIGQVRPDGEVITVNQVALGADSFEEFKTVLDEAIAAAAQK